jgi:lycopene cyclase domain-containing protein
VIGLAYLTGIIASGLGTLALAHRLNRLPSRGEVAPVIALLTTAYLLLDAAGIARGWFYTPAIATLAALPGGGPYGRGLPVEELFMLPFLALLTLTLQRMSRRATRAAATLAYNRASAIAIALVVIAGAAVVASGAPEYTTVVATIAALSLVLVAPLLVADRSAVAALTVLLALTAIFDNVLCAAGVFHYPLGARSGIEIGIAPIEDLIWALGFGNLTLVAGAWSRRSRGTSWRLLLASRPAAWINTALPFLAGVVAAGAEAGGVSLLLLLLWWGVGYNAVLYGINDLYDRTSDELNPRKGGIEGALLQPRDLRALRALLACSATGGLLVAFTDTSGAPFVVSAIALAALYSAPWLGRTRSIPVLDAITSASHFLLPPLCGLALAAQFDPAWLAPLVAFGCWNAGNHLVGAIQDRTADRRAKLATSATLLGARLTALTAICVYLVATVLLAVNARDHGTGFAVAAALPLVNALSTTPLLLKRATMRDARAAWRRFMVLNVPIGAIASVLLIASWQ